MKKLFSLALLVASYVLAPHGKDEDRERMVMDTAKVNESLFRSYGCYCGVESTENGEPKDYIDVCCQILNCCYEALRMVRCDPKMSSYKYTYDGEVVECYTANRALWCETNVCSCDRYYSICLIDSHRLFNEEFVPSGLRDCPGSAPKECFIK
ncbi:basic phospholipase A2 Ts-G6D49-like [Elgaria multicarinata webbii]|uniref:basic phospholipase A2 Ts-G6D49-like n=1 Tax=Elgaria multicarinata webbii TaxID=159646 RepID=UPI002FCD4931